MIEWLGRKWAMDTDATTLAESYRVTFSNNHGARVLSHLLDSVYCTVCELQDPISLATHNGRRSLVHEILQNVDLAEHPDKYKTKVEDVWTNRL